NRKKQISDFIQAICEFCLEKHNISDMINLYNTHHAISYKTLIDTLKSCASLLEKGNLTLSELTLALKTAKHAKEQVIHSVFSRYEIISLLENEVKSWLQNVASD